MILASVTAMCLDTVKELQHYRGDIQKAEYGFCAWFTLELIFRFTFSPSRLKLIKEAMTWVDIISLLPYYIGLFPGQKDNLQLLQLRAIRLVRVFRIFRFFTFTSGLQIIVQSLKASLRELLLLLIILIIPVILFSSFLYEFEKDDVDGKFRNIPESFWWAIITMTTVGYGDLVPTTPVGKVIGSICAICGVLIVALPVSVIGNNFSTYYEHAQARLSLPRKKRRLIMGDANRLCHLQGQSNSGAYESRVDSSRSSPEITEDGLLTDGQSASSLRKYHRRSRGTIYGAGQVYIGHRPKRSVVIGNGVVTRPPESKPKIEPTPEFPAANPDAEIRESKTSMEQIENKAGNPRSKRKHSRTLRRSSSEKLKGSVAKSCMELKGSLQDLELGIASTKMKRPWSARNFQSRVSPEKGPPNLSNGSLLETNHFQDPSLGRIKLSVDVSDGQTTSIRNGLHGSPSMNIMQNGCVSKESIVEEKT